MDLNEHETLECPLGVVYDGGRRDSICGCVCWADARIWLGRY